MLNLSYVRSIGFKGLLVTVPQPTRKVSSISFASHFNVDEKRSIFVGNLRGNRWLLGLKRTFECHGVVVTQVHRTGSMFAYVEFATPEDAQCILQSKEAIRYQGNALSLEPLADSLCISKPSRFLRLRNLSVVATPTTISSTLGIQEHQVTLVTPNTAIVDLDSVDCASSQLDALTAKPPSIEGQEARVSYGDNEPSGPTDTLQVRFTFPGPTSKQLRTLFSQYQDDIVKIDKLDYDSTRCWIKFKNIESAVAVRQTLDGKTFGSTKLVITFKEPRKSHKARSANPSPK